MDAIEEVNIEQNGTFKYILIRLSRTSEGKVEDKVIVRGFQWAEYHGKDCIKLPS